MSRARGFVLRYAGDEARGESFAIFCRWPRNGVNGGREAKLTYFSDNGRSLIKFGDNFPNEPLLSQRRQKRMGEEMWNSPHFLRGGMWSAGGWNGLSPTSLW